MIAVLFVVGHAGAPAFPRSSESTLFVLGISPIAFLVGLLDARLARSAVGDLLVELRSNPRRPGCGTRSHAPCAIRR